MKHPALTLALLASLSLGSVAPALAQAPPATLPAGTAFVRSHSGIQEYKLANGLKVLLVENHAAPVVSVLIVYRVGSRNEAVGYTGSTHFLEHMLFKGSPAFNKAKGNQVAATLLAQGASFNATTWIDRTNYFETLPAEQLDLALEIEADRMRNAFIADADRQSEMSVVRNELERGENNPDRVMSQQLFANAFMAHPYHHPTIGWRSDVEGVPTERLKKFYEDFYYPDNATLVLVGDFKSPEALAKIQQRFGPLKASPTPIPAMYTQEPPQQGERRFEVRRPGQLGIVNMGYHVPPLEHNDSAALDMLQGILSQGVSSRMQQQIVDKGLAVSAYAWNGQFRDPGLMMLTAKVASGKTHAQVEKAMQDLLEQIKKQAPPAAELERVRSQILAEFTYNRHGTYELASALGEYEAMADWRYLLTYPQRIQAVTPADIQRVAQTYLVTHNRTVGHFIPEKVADVPTQTRQLDYQQLPATEQASAAPASSGMQPIQRLSFGPSGRLIVQENHLDQTVAIRGNLYAGSINDPAGKAGLAQLTAAMLERGTKKRNKLAFANALESLGSQISVSAELERVQISGQALGPQLKPTLDLLYEMLTQPAFDAGEFAKLKQQTLDQLKQRLDNTDALSQEALYALLYPAGHPHALSTQQQLQQMEKLTLNDVKAFYAQHYGSNQMILSVVGDAQSAQVAQWTEAALGKWKSDNPVAVNIPDVPAQTSGKQVIKTMKDKANVSMALGVQTDVKLGSPNYFAALLANHALGQSSLSSRLGLRVRDELGLTYGIYSYFPEAGLGAGPWVVGVTTNPDNVPKTLAATREVIAKYLSEGISETEFNNARSSLIGSYLVRLSTNPQIAERLTDAIFYNLGENYLTERAQQIRSVTREQVNAALRTYFDPARLSTAVVGNYDQP